MNPQDYDPSKLTSVEAAALYLSNGQTTDPVKASMMASGQELDMDAMQRSHLRRMMGFDFRIKIQPNKIHVSSKQEPFVTTWMRIKEGDVVNGMIANEETVDRLVDACLRLKLKYEKELTKQ